MVMEQKEPIAIIGSGCRFPGGASSSSKLWELLRAPIDVLQKIPIERFNKEGVYNPDGMYHGSTNVSESYLLSEDYRHFDAQFFKIPPVEAHAIDPQQRLLLETVYESLESAGQSMSLLRGSNTAVYVGLMSEEYGEILSRDIDYLPTHFPTATARSIMSNRVSYVFDWHGPCMTIDTACSSSLVAVHQAVQALRNGDTTMAIASGSNLCIGSKPYISENKFNMLSPGSRSRMWDQDADGYARGDGVASLVLKTLSKALEDGDYIECLIRESGINQDGRTQGITMPSHIAQEALIRETYKKAGLDTAKRSDRPQFFEAHGTGTKAGDPVEAQAIRNAFFGSENESGRHQNDDPLYVGSIKTVIGHTEGTAGIAAVMKASLAIQNSVIPPNLLFERLSDNVAPFYENLQIPTSALPWPSLSAGQPKRASVNSFGFGGTNAHVILESYVPNYQEENSVKSPESTNILPFTFSAASEKSLASCIERFAKYLEEKKLDNLQDLAYTLNFKRSALPFRRSFPATTTDTLLAKMYAAISNTDSIATVKVTPSKNKILGVFTGQGAQWPTMGRALIHNSVLAREIVEKLQFALNSLPKGDQPNWSLVQELEAHSSRSQLNKAELSQPLCTVVQIVLVDMLRLAGIQFDAVVGHSSGEMGAAYAAGYLSAEDAVKIAYYRGLHSAAACSPSGAKGGMLAVGTTLSDAQQLCDLEDLRGRISVAACNSSSSVTLSGDIDALAKAETALIEEGKFVRKLQVDTAYHSHHMVACAAPYIRSLETCNIQFQSAARPGCTWFSSVTGKEIDPSDGSLSAKYWSDNMTRRVNFAQAIEAAVESIGSFGAAFEIGPHPALRGPALQTIQDIGGSPIPYCGTLERGFNDIEAFSNTLAFALSYIPAESLTLLDFFHKISPTTAVKPLKDLPGYAWEHDRIYWTESRLGRAFRTRGRPVHELLGTISQDGSNRGLRWRNVLSPNEVPWIRGHKLQGSIVFPGSGYVSMAFEAAMILAGDQKIRLLEIRDLIMGKAMVFENERSTADIQFTLLIGCSSNGGLEATFHLEGTTNQDSDVLVTFCTGSMTISYGAADKNVLPPRSNDVVDTVAVNEDRFYNSLLPLGYEYSGDFRALTEMQRTTDSCTGFIRQSRDTERKSSLLVHPGTLDCAIQAVMLAYCSPGDNRLWSLHVPTKISRVRLNPTLLRANSDSQALLPVDASISSSNASILGNVEFYAADGQLAVVQVEGIEINPFSMGSPENDAKLFFDIRWNVDAPQGSLITGGARATPQEMELATLCERVAYFYLRTLVEDITGHEWSSAEWYFKHLKKFSDYYIEKIESGKQPHSEKTWKSDTREQIYAEMAKWSDNIDLKLMRSVGENLASTIRGQTTILEHMMNENVLNDFYVKGLGLDKYTNFLSNGVLQLAHRYPRMNILEVGAGTGGVTKTIVRHLKRSLNSYTYTDISSGFFEKAQDVFHEYSDCMIFKTLDVEKDPIAQGFQEHSFDLIVCSLVLHATENLHRTLKNVRRLLKPGGYLAMLEITNTEAIRIGFSMGGLPGWWLGHQDGRELNPCVPADRWDIELRNAGFSGIDTITPEVDRHAWLFSVIFAQATDERVDFLQSPLANPTAKSQEAHLTILEGSTTATAEIAETLQTILQHWYGRIVRIDAIESFDLKDTPESATILSIMDLDEPLFKNLTESRLAGLRSMFEHSRNVLWVTKGARSDNPYAAMMIGFSRTLTMEMPHVRLQFLEHEGSQRIHADRIAETLLRLQVTDAWERQEGGPKMLWTTEPEIAIENDRTRIPRLVASSELNDRYNSVRRPITKKIDLSASDATLALSDAGYSCVEVNPKAAVRHDLGSQLHDYVTIRLSCSLPLAIRISNDSCLFLARGAILKTGEWVFALMPEMASKVTIPRAWTIPSATPTYQGYEELMSLSFELLAQYIVGETAPGQILLVHDASPILAQVIVTRAAEHNVTCAFTTPNQPPKSSPKRPQMIFVHPQSTSRGVRLLMPENVATFVNLSMTSTGIASVIASVVPQTCLKLEFKQLFSKSTIHRHLDTVIPIHNLFKTAYQHHKIVLGRSENSAGATKIKLSDLCYNSDFIDFYPGKIIDWDAPTIHVKVEPADCKVAFRADRTYLLFGLSGQLGRSLALFMARLGAKHIVLTSRKPDVDDKWLQKARKLGVEVRIFANNITDREAVRALVNDIRHTMPQIAGVANGAMVLQDTAITDMNLRIMNRVLSPKVDGSRYLNELFQKDDLDFFILLSSIATICGQHGQSNYTAANMFLNGLAAQRRREGLVGSVMVIGAIVGIGYFEREVDGTTKDRVIQAGYRMISERDFHLLFAETVLAGHPSSGGSYEVITGLREIKQEDRQAQNPIFHHVVVRQDAVNTPRGVSTKVNLKAQVLIATTEENVKESIQEHFLQKLRAMLQLDEVPPLDSGAEELGIDSLVAVEIRSWFLNELDVDIPVLKILGAAQVTDMVELAIQKLPAELTPDVRKETGPRPVNFDQGSHQTPTISAGQSSLASSSDTPHDSDDGAGGLPTPSTEHSTILHAETIARKERMSYGQSRFWFLRSMLEDQTAFNIVFLIQLNGEIDTEQLGRAFQKISYRHSALRTRFVDSDDEPMQEILPEPKFQIEYRKITSRNEVDNEFTRLKSREYKLEKGDLMQISLLSYSSTQHFLAIGYHHINMDSMSLQVLLKDLDKAYRGLPLGPGSLQYVEHSTRQRKAFEQGQMNRELAYWKKTFSDFPQVLPLLPYSKVRARQPHTSYAHSRVDAKISSKVASSIKEACIKYKISPFHFHLATFKTLLARFLKIDDLCIGMTDANRTELNELGSVGLYLNMLPLRFRQQSNQKFTDSAKEAQSKVRNALANSRLPFDVLIEQLNPERSMEYSPIFQAFIDYKPPIEMKPDLFKCKLGEERYDVGQTPYDIMLSIVDDAQGPGVVIFQVQSSLYSRNEADVLIRSYMWILEQFAAKPESSLNSVTLHDPTYVEGTLRKGRGPIVESSWPETISHRIQRIIDIHRSLPSIVDGSGTSLSYQELNLRSTTVAVNLQRLGVEPGSRIAMLLEPSIEWVASLLAILRIGAIYVPLDLRSPAPRLRTVMRDSQASYVLAHVPTLQQAQTLKHENLRIIDVSSIEIGNEIETAIVSKADELGFIFYTSGTTGVPKGTRLKHAGIRNQIESSSKVLKVGPGSRILQQTAFTFDVSLWQTLLSLATGSCLIIASSSQRSDPSAIVDLIVSQKVTLTIATPSEYLWWLQDVTGNPLKNSQDWSTAVAAGELFQPALAQTFRSLQKPNLGVFNAYGPTEASIISHMTSIDYLKRHESIAIGPAIQNMASYIVDKNLNALPIGFPGELVLAGIGIADGYINNNDQTKTKFLPDNFASADFISRGWNRMYRTGDRSRMNEDGTVVVEGRISGDNQVKIRGQRIELQDIEQNLVRTAAGSLSGAIVSVRGDPASFLVAHVTFADGKTPKDERNYFHDLLSNLPVPQYMRPSLIIAIDRLPVTKHFKLDRAAISHLALPEVFEQVGSNDSDGDTASKMKSAWQKVLPKDTAMRHALSENSDFFHVGGNSMGLVRLRREIKTFFGATLSLPSLFQHSTLSKMVELIELPENGIDSKIDWTLETALSLDNSPIPTAPRNESRLTPRIIALTGSTGFLGRTILNQLVANPEVRHIHCIAIRGLGTRSLPAQFSSPKVTLHYGNLLDPNLGLSQEKVKSIFDSIDAIIHNAADVSFMKTFHSLKPINLETTKEVVRLTRTRQTPLHYISTAGVAHLSGLPYFREISAAEFFPPTDGSDGYTASKWASEVYLEKASKAYCQRVWIHRPSSIMGEDPQPTDMMANILKFSLIIRAVPLLQGTDRKVDLATGFIDLIDVENVASGILTAVKNVESNSLLNFTHHVGEMVIPMDSIGRSAHENGGGRGTGFEILTLQDWTLKSRKQGLNELVAEFLSTAQDVLRDRSEDMGTFFVYPRLLKGS